MPDAGEGEHSSKRAPKAPVAAVAYFKFGSDDAADNGACPQSEKPNSKRAHAPLPCEAYRPLALLPPGRRRRSGYLGSLLGSKDPSTRLSTLAAALGAVGGLSGGFFNLPSGDPADHNGGTDNVTGAFFALWSSGH